MSRSHVRLHCSMCKLLGHNSRKCPQRINIPAADEGANPAIEQSGIPAAVQGSIPAAAQSNDVNSQVHGDDMEFQLPSVEAIPLGLFDSLPVEETQVDPLLSVGDNIYPIVDDVNFQIQGILADTTQGEGMTITSRCVKISCGQPPKQRKTILHDSEPPPNAKKHKSLGMTKSITVPGLKYRTRSTMNIKYKHCGNKNAPIDID